LIEKPPKAVIEEKVVFQAVVGTEEEEITAVIAEEDRQDVKTKSTKSRRVRDSGKTISERFSRTKQAD